MIRLKRPFENIVVKGGKWWKTAFSPFPTMFSTLSERQISSFRPPFIFRLQMFSIWKMLKFCQLLEGNVNKHWSPFPDNPMF